MYAQRVLETGDKLWTVYGKKKRVLALLGDLEFYLPEQTENKEVVIRRWWVLW